MNDDRDLLDAHWAQLELEERRQLEDDFAWELWLESLDQQHEPNDEEATDEILSESLG